MLCKGGQRDGCAAQRDMKEKGEDFPVRVATNA